MIYCPLDICRRMRTFLGFDKRMCSYIKTKNLTAVSALILAGCASAPSVTQVADKLPDDQAGYLLASFSVNCRSITPLIGSVNCVRPFDSMFVSYVSREDKKLGGVFEITSSTFDSKLWPDVEGNGTAIRYVCMRMPTGTYDIASATFYSFDGGGRGYQVAIDPKVVMSFTVEAKVVKYIGALKLYSKSGQNAFGIPLYVPGYLEIDANESRDVAQALKKCDVRKPRDKPVKIDFLTVQNTAQHPFVVVKQRDLLKP